MLVLGVVALVVLSLNALCEIVSVHEGARPERSTHGASGRRGEEATTDGSGARGEERDGRSTRRVPGAPPRTSLWHAPCRAPQPNGLHWAGAGCQ